MSDEAACACLHVRYKPVDNGDGSLSERWECELCGTQFVKQFKLNEAHEVIRRVGEERGAARTERDNYALKLDAVQLEADNYRLAVESAQRRGFERVNEVFEAYDALLEAHERLTSSVVAHELTDPGTQAVTEFEALKHDMGRYMAIANSECNRAEHWRRKYFEQAESWREKDDLIRHWRPVVEAAIQFRDGAELGESGLRDALEALR